MDDMRGRLRVLEHGGARRTNRCVMLALLCIGWGRNVAAESAPFPDEVSGQAGPASSVRESSLPATGFKVVYRTFGRALARARCEPGETLLSATCPPGGQPLLLDDADAPGGKVASCRAAPFTLVCAR